MSEINKHLKAGNRSSLESARTQVDQLAADVQYLNRQCMLRFDPPITAADGGQAASMERRSGWFEKNFFYRFALQELKSCSGVFFC